MAFFDTALERAAGIAAGVCVVAAQGNGIAQGWGAIGVGATGLLALMHEATKTHEVDCGKYLEKLTREVKDRLLATNPAFAVEYEDAAQRLSEGLERSFPNPAALAALSVSEKGFLANATDAVIADLNAKGLGFDEPTYNRFAREVVSVALECAFVSRHHFPRIEPYLWITALQTLGGVREDTRTLIAGQEEIKQLLMQIAGAEGTQVGFQNGAVASTTQFERDFVEINYVLEALPLETAEELGIDTTRYLSLRTGYRSRFRNLTDTRRDLDLKINFPIRDGRLRSLSGVTGLEVWSDGYQRSYSRDEIDELTTYGDSYGTCAYTIQCMETNLVDTRVETRLVKEISDNEIWASFYPTRSLALAVRSTVPGLVVGVRALTDSQLVQVASSSELHEWRLEGPMLPYQSIVFWWRQEEPADRR